MYRFSLCMTVGAVLLAVTASPAGIVANLEHHYTFDDPGNLGFDSSGNNRHATPVGSPAWVDDPILGGVVHIPSTARLEALTVQPPDGAFTISMWALRTPDHSGGNDGLFTVHDGDINNKNVAGWVNSSDQIWGRVRDSGGDKGLPANSRARMPGDNLWTHLVFHGDGSTYQVIQDGARVGNAVAYDGASLQSLATLWIGRQGGESWRGYLDDFRVYSRALSDVDISQLIYSIHETPAVKVDFGNSTNNGGGPVGTVPGFVAFKAAEGGSNPPQTRSYYAPFAVGDTARVTVSGYTHFRDYAAVTGGPHADLGPILSDSVLRNSSGTLQLALDDLKPGVYEITTWHHSTQFAGANFDIRLADSFGVNQAIATGLQVSSGAAPADVTTSTFRFSTMGDSVAIRFPTGNAASNTHFALNAFDLNQVHTLYRTDTVLAVDFNHRGTPEASNPGVTQAGFSEFLLPGSAGGTRTFGDLSVTVTSPTGQVIDDRRRGLPTNAGDFTQQELLRDFIFGNGTSSADGLDVLVAGLEPEGLYEVTLWAFDRESGGGRSSDWYANDVLVQEYFFNRDNLPTTNDDYAFSFLAHADAMGELLLAGRAAGGNNPNVFLNAMQLTMVVPEPGTLLLLALGLPVVLLRRRRK